MMTHWSTKLTLLFLEGIFAIDILNNFMAYKNMTNNFQTSSAATQE